MNVPSETESSVCPVCQHVNPTNNKFCGACGASLDLTINAVAKYLDDNLKARLDAVIKDRFRDQTLVETEMAVRVADKISSWGKLFGLYVAVPLVAAVAYLGWLGFDVNQSLKNLQSELTKAAKSGDELSKAAASAKVRVATIEKSADDLQAKIDKSAATLAQVPQLAASVSQLSDRVGRTGAAQLLALQQKGSAIGIDVTRHNAKFDGSQLRSAGISFVYAKASQGSAFVDSSFEAACSSARTAGILCGGYHFLTHESPQAQADFFLKRLESAQTDLPPAVDFEPNASGASATLEDLQAFLVLVQKRTGCTPVVYGGHYLTDMATALNAAKLGAFSLWIAQYGTAPTGSPTMTAWTFWQFSDGLAVQGLPAMDFNAFNGSEAALREFAKKACSRPPR